LDASSDAGLASDQTVAFEAEDHLMNRRRADAEVALHVGFGWSLPEHASIDADAEILALLFGETMWADAAPGA